MNCQDEQYDPEYYTEDEYEEETIVYQYEQEAYSAMRRCCKYIPGENSKTQTGPVVDELEKLRRNTEYNANTRIPTSRTTISGSKRRLKMSSAPIESLTKFNIAEYLQNLPSGLTVGQAAHLLPQYRGGMQYASRRTTSTEKKLTL